jgi:hypothetical protein
MKKFYLIISFLSLALFTKATVHTIYIVCNNIVSDTTAAVCGDTVIWRYGGCSDTLKSTTIPGCAIPWKAAVGTTITSYQMVVPSCPGYYNFSWHGMNGILNVSCITGIPQVINEPLQVSLSPNPSNGNVALKIELITENNITADIYNVIGVKVYSTTYTKVSAGEHSIPLDIKNLGQGVYFVKLSTNSAVVTKRLIVQ